MPTGRDVAHESEFTFSRAEREEIMRQMRESDCELTRQLMETHDRLIAMLEEMAERRRVKGLERRKRSSPRSSASRRP